MKDKRERMVDVIRDRYGFASSEVLSVMLQVPRHKFVSKEHQNDAYKDAPVPIGHGQTMSQPYTIAVMTKLITEALNPKYEILNKSQNNKFKIPNTKRRYKKVLEIGTGSGYQAAVLSKFFEEVYTIEIVPELAQRARSVLVRLGYNNVHVKTGSGQWGWRQKAPFDAIMVTAGVEKVPDELFDQLVVGGVLVAPVGKGSDKVMTRFRKSSARQVKLSNQATKKLSNHKSKLPSNQGTNLLKEEFGIFHFVPFVEEKD